MKVQTTFVIQKPPAEVWPLLCQSKMRRKRPLPFRCGVPKPIECRLPSGQGRPGAERQCISDRGVINQQITLWNEPRELRFEMSDTDLYFGRCVTGIRERFELEEPLRGMTQITRTTEFDVSGWCRLAKSVMIWVGLKNVHRYVFENWAAMTSNN
jgi:hypothetical protein